MEAGTLAPVDGHDRLHLTSDYQFDSPSAAAAVLLGRPASGPVEWKDDSGKSLKQLREEALG
jgi:hypothetical protein